MKNSLCIIIIIAFVVIFSVKMVFAYDAYNRPSCSEAPSTYKTAQYSLDYCVGVCGSGCALRDTECGNYCSGTCCSYCICDPCGDVSPPPAEQCGGSESNVVHDSDPLSKTSCTFHCKCPDYAGQADYDFDTCSVPCADQIAQADQECGQGNYTMDNSQCTYTCNNTPGTCPAGCETVCQQKQAECGGSGYVNYYFTDEANCIAQCNPSQPCPENCKSICDSMISRCGSAGFVFTDEENCVAQCKDPSCAERAIERCGTLENVTWDNVETCSFHCTDCEAEFQQAREECPYGFDGGVSLPDAIGGTAKCSYKCKGCKQLASECGDHCYGDNSYAVSQCSETDGVVTENLCRCRSSDSSDPADPSDPDPKDNPPQTCDDARARCNLACTFLCNADNPSASVCDCSNNPDPETPDNPDPSDPSDDSGWLSGIKGELKEANGWLEAIKHNTDVANDLQKEANEDIDNIAENMRRSVDNQGKLQKTSEEGNKLLGDIKNAIDGLDDINVNISQEGGAGFEATISASTDGVESLGTTGDVTGEGYTTDDTPSNIALPAEQTINDSFGTFTLSEEPSYRDQLASSLSSLSPQVSNPQCATSLDIPWFDISSFSITSKNISMDFCPYESYLSWLGQFLVLCVSLRQLYLLAA